MLISTFSLNVPAAYLSYPLIFSVNEKSCTHIRSQSDIAEILFLGDDIILRRELSK